MADMRNIRTVEELISGVLSYKLNRESEDSLLDDVLAHHDSVLGGLRLMGRLLEQNAMTARSRKIGPDEMSGDELEDLGKYMSSTADLLSGLSTALCELASNSSLRRNSSK
ncbi:hypothetical protein WP3W18E02_43060 [Klebsiella sp. WP3-W18-ESBL-02]|uniref:hypothetical protein n=1 Tax=Klebsiella sp. WP3-W18-ESBL-02 TaxID=2675710 RepID=UPI0015DCA38D|nr:hypothetical protein [Klebsiella sp. WP3-W18-ESBL-02]BBQ85753.1 hypothetical protein WP3W18E02_42820 [Klebsiella sp. WP3-W18-ESBL-02]BBQ85777.1 hypothetical protein WP3W18E02_43060 [Klebsiella sp. WP3-W18-ESBL-02]